MLTLLMLAPAPGQAAPTAAPVPVLAASDPSYDDGPPPVKHQGSAQPGGSLQTGVNLNKIGDPVANAETPPAADFSLTEGSSSLTLLAGSGGSGSSTISVSPINSFTGDVTLGVSAGYGLRRMIFPIMS